MLHVFVATIAPGRDPDKLLTEETQQETQAQVMTPDEAAAVGFKGIAAPRAPPRWPGLPPSPRATPAGSTALEANPGVTSYKVSEIE